MATREDSVFFEPQAGYAFEERADEFSNDFNTAFMNEFPLYENGSMSPAGLEWQPQQHSQVDILYNRSSVSHQFGQITPPDDEYKTFSNPSSFAHPSAQSSAPTEQILSARSERARVAANSRHSKAKRARRDSVRKIEEADEEVDGGEDKRERYREKNRQAAAKCRQKKKMNTDDLELSAREVTAQNNRLRAEERELRDLFSSLRDQALAHDPSQGCNCQTIHAYNLNKAQETARATMGFMPGMMPSPIQRSLDSASPSTVGTTSRTQSFSSVRPQFAQHPRRQQSNGTSMAFMPQGSGSDVMRHASMAGDMTPSPFAFSTAPQVSRQSPFTGGHGDGDEGNVQEMSDSQQYGSG